MDVPDNWHLNDEHKESKKLNEMVTAQAKKLRKAILDAENDEQKYVAVFTFYRKYYTLTLTKTSLGAGINNSPARDIILDYPWKELKLNRFQCLKIWEKINH
jgi:hypothetical protein